MANDFQLDPILVQNTVPVGETELCQVLLSQDSRFPWIMLVPRKAGLRELHDLEPVDQILLMGEISHIAQEMKAMFGATKTNIASLGNRVSQLHIHIVMRFEEDDAWPGAIWDSGDPVAYDEGGLAETLELIRACLP